VGGRQAGKSGRSEQGIGLGGPTPKQSYKSIVYNQTRAPAGENLGGEEGRKANQIILIKEMSGGEERRQKHERIFSHGEAGGAVGR